MSVSDSKYMCITDESGKSEVNIITFIVQFIGNNPNYKITEL